MQYLTIDPLNSGNYASRLSHSCSPNCTLVPIIREHKYCLCLFTNREIKFGEELTFNYESVRGGEG